MRIISEPASANAIAISAPIPRVAPVIIAVLPSRENISNMLGAMVTVILQYSKSFCVRAEEIYNFEIL